MDIDNYISKRFINIECADLVSGDKRHYDRKGV